MKKLIISIVVLFYHITSFAQVGIGIENPDESTVLQLESNDKGFLPPRMTTQERQAINDPAVGLTIFNTEENCVQFYNGIGWFNACDRTTFVPTKQGSEFDNGFEDNTTCENATISVTPCLAVAGATLNDDPTTPDGIEYDWSEAAGSVSGGNVRALVEINGQCWFRRNSIVEPTAPCADPMNTGCNVWLNEDPGDIGSWGYRNTSVTNGSEGWATSETITGEGLLYQFSAAMNGSTEERTQGVCPTGWHIPSDCEWMYLENSLGMDVAQQANIGVRSSGEVGSKLSSETLNGNNSAGFSGLLLGSRFLFGSFATGSWTRIWSSTETDSDSAVRRDLEENHGGVRRTIESKTGGHSVRCIKD